MYKFIKSPTGNVSIFIAALLLIIMVSGWIGLKFPSSDPSGGPEMLFWLLGPTLVAIVLITVGKWWGKVGLRLNVRSGWRMYLIAFAVSFPLCGVLLFVSSMAGIVNYSAVSGATMASAFGALLAPLLIKNLFEEFAWRGFLTSRLQDTPLAGLKGHLLTGLVWATWHLPYWYVFLDATYIQSVTGVSLNVFVITAFIILPIQAIFYGELRIWSGSMWPPFIMHFMANLMTFLILDSGFASIKGMLGLFITPGTHGLLYSVILGAIGYWMLQRRLARSV